MCTESTIGQLDQLNHLQYFLVETYKDLKDLFLESYPRVTEKHLRIKIYDFEDCKVANSNTSHLVTHIG